MLSFWRRNKWTNTPRQRRRYPTTPTKLYDSHYYYCLVKFGRISFPSETILALMRGNMANNGQPIHTAGRQVVCTNPQTLIFPSTLSSLMKRKYVEEKKAIIEFP